MFQKSILISRIKILLVFLLALFFISSTNVEALTENDVVDQTKDFYVADYANILSTEVESHIINTNLDLDKKTDAQVVVVTINSLNGNSIEEYATTLFRKFGIGDKEKNNGVLLLLAKNDRKFRIAVGYGLEGFLTDGKTGRIQDNYIIPYLKNNNWDAGVKNGFDAVISEISSYYKVSISNVKPVSGSPEYSFSKKSLCIFIGLFIFNVFFKIIVVRLDNILLRLVYKVYAIMLCAIYYYIYNQFCMIFVMEFLFLSMLDFSRGGGGSSFYDSSFGSSTSSSSFGGGGSTGGGGSSRNF